MNLRTLYFFERSIYADVKQQTHKIRQNHSKVYNLSVPWWVASEVRKISELTQYNIIVILTNGVYIGVTES